MAICEKPNEEAEQKTDVYPLRYIEDLFDTPLGFNKTVTVRYTGYVDTSHQANKTQDKDSNTLRNLYTIERWMVILFRRGADPSDIRYRLKHYYAGYRKSPPPFN